MPRPIYRRRPLAHAPTLVVDARACTAAFRPHVVTSSPRPPTAPEVPNMAKKMVKKNGPAPANHFDDLVKRASEATVARFAAARAPADVPADVPGVTRGDGGKPAHAVGAVGFGDLSPAVVRKLAASFIKNGLEMAVKFGGGAVEDLAEGQREALAEFIPDAAYEFVEKLMHQMHGNEPHTVGTVGGPTPPA